MKERFKKITDYKYCLEKEGSMKVPAEIFMNEKLFEGLEEGAIGQLRNVTELPGIYKKAMAMPDSHQGYGFPIGGVAAIDYEQGCISPGGIGFDINCGVRLLATDLDKEKVEARIKELLEALYKHVPVGVGRSSDLKLADDELDNVLENGSRWAHSKGYGNEDDCDLCEEGGKMPGAKAAKVSPKAKARGRNQLGTLGAGNHFLEVQIVEQIYDKDIAEKFGVTREGQIVVMIHCGSRGLGHQVCSDYLRKMEEKYPDIMQKLPEKDLIYAPAGSDLANDYYAAMAASANFAWANRHMIAHNTRKAFHEIFPEARLDAVYDVAHNIAKIEEHEIDGELKKCYVHRKGATRAFGPGRKEIPEKYREVGQPILIPGSMGTASYVLVGTAKAEEETFGSTAHGAGRLMSRFKAIKSFNGDRIRSDLAKVQIYVKARSTKGISEEAPGAYKDVDEVVKTSHDAGIGNLVVKVRPLGVLKG